MRVSSNSQYVGFTRHVNKIQLERDKAQTRVSTGKDIITLSDNPEKVVDIKLFEKKIAQNENYINILDLTMQELYAVDDSLRRVADVVQIIRYEAIDATNQDSEALQVLGEQFKGLLDDLVREANSDFNGHFLFAGTKTTPQSIKRDFPEMNENPFQIIAVEPTDENPSGLTVRFKGNNNDRVINKDQKNTQIINQKSDEIFGPQMELFNLVIEMHNILSYNNEGEVRTDADFFNENDMKNIDRVQQGLATFYDDINRIAARNGTYLNRVDGLKNQLIDETLRLKDYRSVQEDTDIADAIINLTRQENALNYALQVGARINQVSLFDFLR
jgi:flagellar hook-associated protein 3 FlgL